MSSTSFVEQITALELVVMGRRAWLTRAQRGELKRAPAEIERKADSLQKLEDLLAKCKAEANEG